MVYFNVFEIYYVCISRLLLLTTCITDNIMYVVEKGIGTIYIL